MQDEPSANSFLTPALYDAANDIETDRQIVGDEIGRERIVGKNSADMTGGKKHRIGLHLLEPALGVGLLGQIERLAAGRQNLAAFAGEPPHNRRTRHAIVAGHIDALASKIEQQRLGHGLSCSLRAGLDGRLLSGHLVALI